MHVSGRLPYETTNTLCILFGRLEYDRLDCMLCCPKEKNLIRRKLSYPRLIILFIDVFLLKIRVFYLPFRHNERTSKVHNCDNVNAFCILSFQISMSVRLRSINVLRMLSAITLMDHITAHAALDSLEMEQHAPVCHYDQYL